MKKDREEEEEEEEEHRNLILHNVILFGFNVLSSARMLSFLTVCVFVFIFGPVYFILSSCFPFSSSLHLIQNNTFTFHTKNIKQIIYFKILNIINNIYNLQTWE